jgi:TonB-linked SusC/RagA family outer membrane protein
MRKVILTLLVAVAFMLNATAQSRVITGKVIDDKGNPVSGVSVTSSDGKGTQTDRQGNYSLNVGPDAKAVTFSSVSFDSQTSVIGVSSNISITMKGINSKLDEVVVVAYGVVKKGNATSAVTNVKAADFQNRPLTNISSSLEGAAPGIQVLSANGQPGSSQSIRIRGFGSINASNDPLYVLDGAPYSGPISAINMDDVESVSVLKDASGAALYGSRAANGVIIITTKRGKKFRNNLSFKTVYGSVARGLPEYERVGVNDYYPLMWQAYRNSLAFVTTTTPTAAQYATANTTATNGIKALLGYNPFNVANNAIVGTDGKLNPSAQLLYADDLDWSKDIIRNGSRHEYGLNYSGGNDKSDYFASFGYVKEQGFSIKSDLNRFSGRLSANTNPLSWFKTGVNLASSMSYANSAQDGTSTSYVNPFNFIRNIGPIYPVHAHNQTTGVLLTDPNGNTFYDFGNLSALGLANRPAGASAGRHIAAETMLNENSFRRNVMSGRTYGTINFTKHLDLTSSVAIDITDLTTSIYGNKLIGDAAPSGRSSKEAATTKAITFNQILNYNRKFGKHNVSALAGHENYELTITDAFVQRSNQIFDGNTELINFAVAGDSYSSTDRHKIESYLSRVSYDYDSKYLFSAAFRQDGNSRFKRGNRWNDFWSFGAAWRIDGENFMKNIRAVNYLKIRSSYGELGQDAGIGYYPYQALYGLGYNNGTDPGVIQTNLKNDSISWETSKNFDLAIEFSLFKSRINATVEYYKKTTDGLIFPVPQPLSNGGTPAGGYIISKNIGEMYNKGFEIHLDGDVIRSKNITWNIGVNLSTLKNRITKMPPGQPTVISGTKRLEVGHSLYDFWLRDWQGVDPLDGMGLYRADNGSLAATTGTRIRGIGDTVTTNQNNARLLYQGTAIPKYWGSITTNLKYKNFEFSALFAYSVGGKIYDGIYAGMMDNGTNYGAAQHIDALKAWQVPGQVTTVPRMDNAPRISGTSTAVQFNAQSSRWLIDASYFNVRNISFAYTFPKIKIGGVETTNTRFFINGENLGLFSKRQGLNPQQSFTGVTSNAYPPSRVISMGLNVNL